MITAKGTEKARFNFWDAMDAEDFHEALTALEILKARDVDVTNEQVAFDRAMTERDEQICDECGGSGELEETDEDGNSYFYKTCPECRGQGLLGSALGAEY